MSPSIVEDRRYPLQPFDRAVLEEFLGGRSIVECRLFTAGKCNSNYRLVLEDGTNCVFRSFSRGRGSCELYAMEQARSVVPVPDILARGESWVVLSLVEGEHLSNQPEVLKDAARLLARLCEVRFEKAGWIEPDGSITPFSFGDLKGFYRQHLILPEVQQWLGSATVDRLLDSLDRWADRFDPGPVHLVHGDFNPTNILVRDGRVVGIVDWEFSHSGSIYMDLGNLLRHANPDFYPAIGAGLKAGGFEPASDWIEHAEWIDLSSQVEFLTSPRSDDFKKSCVARIRQFIDRYAGKRCI